MNRGLINRVFTSKSVIEGHPDKMCGQISDAVLDAILEKDSQARMACECTTITGMVSVFEAISTRCYVDIPTIVHRVVAEIGYDCPEYGFDSKTCAVLCAIDGQSPDITVGVDRSYECREQEGKACGADDIGAGDQGMVFGFACDEPPELMPVPISYAHQFAQRLAAVRKNGTLSGPHPGEKTQVSVQHGPDGSIIRIPAN